MLDTIKRYELNDYIDLDSLKEYGFKEGGFIYKDSKKVFLSHMLKDDISIHMEIKVNEDGSLEFDDFDSIYVLDEEFLQPYMPFYQDKTFGFLKAVIHSYNCFMDTLVEAGILKEKELEKVKTLKR